LYCIYTDKEVAETDGNYDHIIPLALGGDNGFRVWSDKKFNFEMGSKIDGALANDSLIMFARRDADARGHSGTEPIPVWKRTTLEGRPVQISWGDEVKVWDAKSRTYVDPNDFLSKPMESRWIYNPFARSKFTAKVALGGGHFLFGEPFRQGIDCNELRKLLAADDLTKFPTTLIAHDTVLKGKWLTDIRPFRLMCELKKRTTFIALPYADGVAFYLGILGMYVGAIFCRGDSSKLVPPEGEVILLGPGAMERLPFKTFASETLELINAWKSSPDPEPETPD
jgi:hypothetical protein